MGYTIYREREEICSYSCAGESRYNKENGRRSLSFVLPSADTSEVFIVKLQKFIDNVKAEPLYPEIKEMEKNAPDIHVDIWGFGIYKTSSLKWEEMGEQMSRFNIQVARLKYMLDYAVKLLKLAEENPGDIWDSD